MWTISAFADEIARDFELQCDTLASLGLRHIELRSAWGVNVLDLGDSQLKEVAAVLRGHGISTSSIGSPIGKIGIADRFDPHLEQFARALEIADELGAPYLRLFSFFIPYGCEPRQHRDEVLRRMTSLAARAEGHDVILVHENEKEVYGDIPQRCLDIVESVGSPSLRLAWDAANFVQCGIRPFSDGYATLRPYVDYIQVKDALFDTGEVVPAGEGDGEIVETVRALRADGFNGFFSLEPHLQRAGQLGGFSGVDLFTKAHAAFTGILHTEGIEFA
jgi:sugar phosphate isomerase/epimerase